MTNLDTEQYVVFWIVVLEKDLKIVDSDGKLLAMNPGQSRGRLLIDNGGTPKDPYDDEFVEDLGTIKGSAGRSDDLCAAMVPALV